jgi:hypothetical protein
MGYRSDVVLMAVFGSEEHFEEVMSIYRMDKDVQAHELENYWRKEVVGEGKVVLIYQGESVKWYPTYEDVQGLEHMVSLLHEFWQNREYSYAWANYRIGEEDSDISSHIEGSGDDLGNELREIIYDNLSIQRSIGLSL